MGVRRTREEWAAIITEFEVSGRSLQRFCRTRRIRPATFKWWRWRLREEQAAAAADEVRLVPVDVVGDGVGMRGANLVVIAVGDIELRADVGTNVRYIAALVAELRSRC